MKKNLYIDFKSVEIDTDNSADVQRAINAIENAIESDNGWIKRWTNSMTIFEDEARMADRYHQEIEIIEQRIASYRQLIDELKQYLEKEPGDGEN